MCACIFIPPRCKTLPHRAVLINGNVSQAVRQYHDDPLGFIFMSDVAEINLESQVMSDAAEINSQSQVIWVDSRERFGPSQLLITINRTKMTESCFIASYLERYFVAYHPKLDFVASYPER